MHAGTPMEAHHLPHQGDLETMRHRGHTLVVLGWLLGWAGLLAVGPGHAAERYVISSQKSQFRFTGYSLLVKAPGMFRSFSGEIVADAQQLGASHVRFVIDAASLDTANTKRDKHLRSEDFLFVEK